MSTPAQPIQTQGFDPRQDKDFMAAPMNQKIAYLSSIDSDFAKASKQDQMGYLDHILNGPPSKSPIPPDYGFTAGHMASQAWQGAKQLGSGLLNLGEQVIDPRVPVVGSTHMQNGNVVVDPNSLLGSVTAGLPEQQAEASRLWSQPGIGNKVSAVGHGIASYLPFLGPWAASLGQQAGTGDVGGSVAKGGTQAGLSYLLPKVPGVAKVAREAAATKMYTPEGELTPGAKVGSKLATAGIGEAVGTLVGHPWAGGLAGWESGPYFLRKLFPEPAEQVAARAATEHAQELEKQSAQAEKEALKAGRTAPGPWNPAAAKSAYKNSLAPPEPELGTAENPGWMARLPIRMPINDNPVLKPSFGSGGTFTNSPDLPRTPIGPPPIGSPTNPDIKFVGKFKPPGKSVIQDPNSPPPDVRVTYQSIPQPDLLRMVRGGDMEAIREWQRRGLALPENVGFMTESGAGTLPWRRHRR